MKHMVIDPFTQIEIIHNLSDKLKTYYIFPEIAEQIGLCLKKHLEEGAYADITEGETFALALTIHLQEVNHDEHLWVKWHSDPLPDHDGALRHHGAWQEEQRLKAKLENFGIHRVERLPGYIGYIEIQYFHRAAWGGDTLVAAMHVLANVNGIIAAQPPWQLPTIAGFGLCGCSARTCSTKRRSAEQTSSSV